MPLIVGQWLHNDYGLLQQLGYIHISVLQGHLAAFDTTHIQNLINQLS